MFTEEDEKQAARAACENAYRRYHDELTEDNKRAAHAAMHRQMRVFGRRAFLDRLMGSALG